jgi:hypothetical protein
VSWQWQTLCQCPLDPLVFDPICKYLFTAWWDEWSSHIFNHLCVIYLPSLEPTIFNDMVWSCSLFVIASLLLLCRYSLIFSTSPRQWPTSHSSEWSTNRILIIGSALRFGGPCSSPVNAPSMSQSGVTQTKRHVVRKHLAPSGWFHHAKARKINQSRHSSCTGYRFRLWDVIIYRG